MLPTYHGQQVLNSGITIEGFAETATQPSGHESRATTYYNQQTMPQSFMHGSKSAHFKMRNQSSSSTLLRDPVGYQSRNEKLSRPDRHTLNSMKVVQGRPCPINDPSSSAERQHTEHRVHTTNSSIEQLSSKRNGTAVKVDLHPQMNMS